MAQFIKILKAKPSLVQLFFYWSSWPNIVKMKKDFDRVCEALAYVISVSISKLILVLFVFLICITWECL